MFSSKIPVWLGPVIIAILTLILYRQFFFFGNIPMPGDTLIGAYFPWLDYKWGFAVGVPVKNALISDVFSQFFLWKYLIVDIFKHGQIPLWNNFSLGGTPLLATYHSAVFNPFNLLLFLPKFYGWGVFISLQTFFAMLGMFLLLGVYVRNFWARIFGAVVFSLSGLMTTWVEFGTGVWAASALPWIFLFLEKYLSTARMRYLFLMSLSLIVLYLSGHAQLTLYSTILVIIFLILKFLRKRKIETFIRPAVFVILAGVFCAFQFLPTYEFTKESIRSNEAYSSSFNYGLNPSYEVVKFFSADFFGNPTTNNYWDTQSYHEQSLFLGTIPFILILGLMAFQFKEKKLNFWAGVFIISIILGFENPLTKLLYSLPLPLITYSSAARIFFLTSFSGGILASFALEQLSDRKFRNQLVKVNFYFLGSLIGILAGFIGLILFLQDYTQFPSIAAVTENYKVTVKNLLLPIGIAFFSFATIIFVKLKPEYVKFAVVLLLVFSFADLSRYFYKYNPFVPQDLVFPQTPITEFLKKQDGLFRIARLDSEVMPPNTWTYYKLQSIEGYDPLISENYARLFNIIKGESYGSTLSRYRELDNFNPKFIDSLNVKYLLSVKRDEKTNVKGNILDPKIDEYGYKVVFEDGNTVVAKNPNVLERAYFASKLQYFKDKKDLIKTISSENFDSRKEALILDELSIPEVTGLGQVEILSYNPNKIELKTQTKNDEFLIFADTFNKGWKLFRNGVPDRIYETNLALRGIIVPSGKNTYVMQYFPDSFKYGIWLSLGAFVGYLLILFYSVWKKKI